MPHIHAQIDWVVSCFIVRNGRTLLVKHKKLKTWLPVGGHVELHQTADEAMDVEITEEAGIAVEYIPPPMAMPDYPPYCTTPHNHNARRLRTPWAVEIHDFPGFTGHRHMVLIYLAKGLSDDVKLEEAAHDDIQWFTPEEIDKMRRTRDVLDTIAYWCQYSLWVEQYDK